MPQHRETKRVRYTVIKRSRFADACKLETIKEEEEDASCFYSLEYLAMMALAVFTSDKSS